ncbi:MAG TPA: zinc-binding alcohol dehydrogenase family protein [Acidobacteriaceae bacterium]
MKRLRLLHFGIDGLQLEEVPLQDISPQDSLVQVKAAGLNPSDLANVKGAFSQTTLPRVPGRDYSGIVVEGPAEWKGIAVWGSGAELGFTKDGTHEECVALPTASLVAKPANLSFAAAAAAGVPCVTAYLAMIEAAQVKAGETALIIGAAGSVGKAACQLAKAKGARVLGVVRTPEQIPGVEVLLSSDEIPKRVHEMTGGRGVDLCLDTVSGPMFPVALDSLAEGGRLAVIVAKGDGRVTFSLRDFYHHRLRLLGVDSLKTSATAAAQIYRELTPLFEAGILSVDEPEQIPLENATEAYRQLEQGDAAKITIVP